MSDKAIATTVDELAVKALYRMTSLRCIEVNGGQRAVVLDILGEFLHEAAGAATQAQREQFAAGGVLNQESLREQIRSELITTTLKRNQELEQQLEAQREQSDRLLQETRDLHVTEMQAQREQLELASVSLESTRARLRHVESERDMARRGQENANWNSDIMREQLEQARKEVLRMRDWRDAMKYGATDCGCEWVVDMAGDERCRNMRAEKVEQQLEQATSARASLLENLREAQAWYRDENQRRGQAEDAIANLRGQLEQARLRLDEWPKQHAAALQPHLAAEAELDAARTALKELRINANRLCDRNQGGTYEEDCRRSIAHADAVLSRAFQAEQVSHD